MMKRNAVSANIPRMRFLPIFVLAFSAAVFAEDAGTLLSGYLENDIQLKKYSVTAESKSLALSSAKIDAGVSVSLSTGNVRVYSSGKKTKITASPSVGVSVPSASALDVSAKLPVTVEDGERTFSDGTVSATVGILSGSALKKKVSVLEAERALLEARRDVKKRAYSAEKEFYESLKSLYNRVVSVLDSRSDLYDDESDLRVLSAQGYSRSSASFRRKSLEVEEDRRNVGEKERVLVRETVIFARKCGASFGGDAQPTFDDVVAFLPSSVPVQDAEDVYSRDRSLYAESEEARWKQFIGGLSRRADPDMTLSVSGEYKMNDSFYGGNSDSAGGSLSFSWRGVSAGAGVFVPTGRTVLGSDSESGGKNEPYCVLSLSLSPDEWRLAGISRMQDELSARLESLGVDSADDGYDSAVLDAATSLADAKWKKKARHEEYLTNKSLESDMRQWLRQGSVTEKDYQDAKNSCEQARFNELVSDVELLIVNDKIRLMFVEE